MVMHHDEPDCLLERMACCLQGQGHSYGWYNQSMTFSYIIWTADPFATTLGFMVHHHKVDCLVKRLDCSAVVKVKTTEKVKNSSECSSGQYLLSCWTVCNQTWYGDVSSWARASCKNIGLLSSRSRSQWGSYNQTVSTISTELLIFLQPLMGWYFIIDWSILCKNWIVVFKVKATVKVQNFIESLCMFLFCTTDLLATKVGVLICYY